MSTSPPIRNVTITCRACGHTQTRTFKAWIGDRVTLWCNGYGCKAQMTITLEP